MRHLFTWSLSNFLIVVCGLGFGWFGVDYLQGDITKHLEPVALIFIAIQSVMMYWIFNWLDADV